MTKESIIRKLNLVLPLNLRWFKHNRSKYVWFVGEAVYALLTKEGITEYRGVKVFLWKELDAEEIRLFEQTGRIYA